MPWIVPQREPLFKTNGKFLNLEPFAQLHQFIDSKNIYQSLCKVFQYADEKYNSGLFHFSKQNNRPEPPDEITLELKVDDAPLKRIIKSLYYPESPYEFSVLPVDILGQVYEQFLGKIIRLSTGHRAVIEDKPLVRKAGGVFYTPTYVVDYIVAQTVGHFLEGKTPKQVTSLRIVDPACGSGSFLLGAYQHLIDWHLRWYVKNGVRKHERELFRGPGGEWCLTLTEKKRILLTNIFGVDIDAQAVETTKLSLMLRLLEDEFKDSLDSQLQRSRQQVLPDLGDNIRCGNSLVGDDIFDNFPKVLFSRSERLKLNAVSWEDEFKEVFRRGNPGFDIVIGNPPYGSHFSKTEADYLELNYRVFKKIKDAYACFLERGLSIGRRGAWVSYIVPSAWLGGPDYISLREFILGHRIEKVIALPFDVFREAYVDTCILVTRDFPPSHKSTVRTFEFDKHAKLASITIDEPEYQSIKQKEWSATVDKKFVLDAAAVGMISRLKERAARSFGDVTAIKRGVHFTGNLLTEVKSSDESYRYFEGDVYRYKVNTVLRRWLEFNDRLSEKPKEFSWFEDERILVRRLVNRQQRLMAALVTRTFLTNKNLYSVLAKPDNDLRVILGILNSKLYSFLYVKQVSQATKDDFPQVTITDLSSLPFPDETIVRKYQSKLVQYVDKLSWLSSSSQLARTPTVVDRTGRIVASLERKVDEIVYSMFKLSKTEIRIIERFYSHPSERAEKQAA